MPGESLRQRFDEFLDDVVADLPAELKELMEVVPVIVDDEPSPSLLERLRIDAAGVELCGLHSGVPLTHRSVQHGHRLPDRIMMFRGPIMRVSRHRGLSLRNQIRTTLLHEMGHHFGLDEDDLARLGYA